jgi:hypothetical protein
MQARQLSAPIDFTDPWHGQNPFTPNSFPQPTTVLTVENGMRPPYSQDLFLPGVENNPRPGPYADAIRMMQAAGPEYPQIWHMFAFRPDATTHLARFTQEIMREPGPLSPG